MELWKRLAPRLALLRRQWRRDIDASLNFTQYLQIQGEKLLWLGCLEKFNLKKFVPNQRQTLF